jgi:hypothetical protein
MRYQLVLQFRGDSLVDYDQMIVLEERLAEELGHSAEVDGHDCGSGETNIFIFTSDPAGTFRRIRQTLKRQGRMESVAAAYRPIHGKQLSEKFIVIWPQVSTEEFRIA